MKKAIRFLRAHADEYGIDPDRVAVGGESAGGNLASMVGVTNDIAAFDVGEYPEQSSHVSAVVNFYGPAVLVKEPGKRSMDGIPLPDTAGYSRTIQLLGFDPEAEPERAAKTAAQYYINENTVPFFPVSYTHLVSFICGSCSGWIYQKELFPTGKRISSAN